jgi:hypothetical protein
MAFGFMKSKKKFRAVFPTDQSVQWIGNKKGKKWKLVRSKDATLFDSEEQAWEIIIKIFNNYYNKKHLIRRGFVIRKN